MKKSYSWEKKTKISLQNRPHNNSLLVDAEKQLVSSFAAFVLLFNFLVLLPFENCFYCFCQWCSRTTENGRNTFFAHTSS